MRAERGVSTRKAVIIGAGRVGSHAALCLMFRHLVNEIVFLDVSPEHAQAQVLDLEDLASSLGESFVIRVGTYADCADAHFVILTAGRSRKPGETRLEMLGSTVEVLKGIVGPVRDSGFHGIVISVSNPADVVTEYLYRELGLPRAHVIGTGTALDTARLRRALSAELGVQNKQVQAFCMGEHGDSMFIPPSYVTIEGISLHEYLRLRHREAEQIDFVKILERVRASGSQIVSGKGCTEFGIGQVVADLVAAILHDEKRVMPLSAHLDGEYGQGGISIGTPCVVGDDGIEEVFELSLNGEELAAMQHSCEVVRSAITSVMPA